MRRWSVSDIVKMGLVACLVIVLVGLGFWSLEYLYAKIFGHDPLMRADVLTQCVRLLVHYWRVLAAPVIIIGLFVWLHRRIRRHYEWFCRDPRPYN